MITVNHIRKQNTQSRKPRRVSKLFGFLLSCSLYSISNIYIYNSASAQQEKNPLLTQELLKACFAGIKNALREKTKAEFLAPNPLISCLYNDQHQEARSYPQLNTPTFPAPCRASHLYVDASSNCSSSH